MCSVSAALIGLQAAQGVSQIVSTRQQTKAQAAYYQAQADAANQNARIADKQREQLSDKYLEEQKQLDSKRRLAIGQHAAEAGASGFTNTGSVQDMDSSAWGAWKDSSMNLLANQRNDTKSAYINQVNYINQANSAIASAKNVKAQGRAAMFGTLLSTAASIYGLSKNFGSAGNGAGTGAGTKITSSGTSLYDGTAKLSTGNWIKNNPYNFKFKGFGT